MNIIVKAARTASMAHRGQTRRVTNRPYIEHPARVAGMAATLGLSEEGVAAAYLHDVVEDCNVTVGALRDEFGPVVAQVVESLTKPSQATGNRAARTAAFIEQLKGASREAQVIKLLDRLDNLRDVAGDKPDFIALYCRETEALLDAIGGAAEDIAQAIRAELKGLQATCVDAALRAQVVEMRTALEAAEAIIADKPVQGGRKWTLDAIRRALALKPPAVC